MIPQPAFLPMTIGEARKSGIRSFDIILVTGDAYVDHPSFGTALIGRVLWEAGFTVGIIAQPDWRSGAGFSRLGRPRLFFGVSSGNIDSMVNHFTAEKKRRKKDAYSPGGVPRRPDRATIVYADRLHAMFPDTPVILGGIEASLRRFAHYDYWSDRVRRSILADAPADLLAFGMAERQICTIARRLDSGEQAGVMRDIPGTAYRLSLDEWRVTDKESVVEVPGFTDVAGDPVAYARAFALHYREQDPVHGRPVAQPHPKGVIIQNPPALPLTAAELDRVYELPFSRRAHPSYTDPVPALEPVRFSITSHRGCFGGCSFCALTHHQGRIVRSRTEESLIREAERISRMPGFAGTIQDVGGPTANMYGSTCSRWELGGACSDKVCGPECRTLSLAHDTQIRILSRMRHLTGVKHVFVSSGIRHDLVLADPGPYLREVCGHHISGHLKVAPEHISRAVTTIMRKPPVEVFDRFRREFDELQAGKKPRQYILPYFMSGHPGCTIRDMVDLAEYIRNNRLYTEQVQDFTPTPMTLSSCMYYTGLDPFSLEKVHIPAGREKRIQRALLHYREPGNADLVEEGLMLSGRPDLDLLNRRRPEEPPDGQPGTSRKRKRE